VGEERRIDEMQDWLWVYEGVEVEYSVVVVIETMLEVPSDSLLALPLRR